MKHHKYDDDDLITVTEASSILNLSAKTIHNRSGGTAKLLRVKHGRSTRLIREEVLAHKRERIEVAERKRMRIYGS